MSMPFPANLVFLTPDEIEQAGGSLTPAEQAMLEAVNEQVAASESLKGVLEFLLRSGAEVFPCDRIGLAFFEEDGLRATAYSVETRYQPVALRTGYIENTASSSLKDILDRGVIRIIQDLEAYLREHPDSRSTRLLVEEGVRSNMTCPLQVEGRRVGVLFRSARRSFAYDAHQALLHLRMAGRLSQAVEKAWQIEQLHASNQAYLEMLAFISHEIKNPLAGIITDARLLTGGYLGALQDRQVEWVGRIERKADYLLGLVREYLDLARLEGGQLAFHPTPNVQMVPDVLEPALEVAGGRIAERRMSVVRHFPADIPPVKGDPGLLKIVFANLLDNAAKYGNEGGTITLGVRTEKERLEIAVRNTGPGFPAEERDKLFRRFSRLQSRPLAAQKGTGLGLYTCWRIVQLHQGRITAESRPGEWAEFAVFL